MNEKLKAWVKEWGEAFIVAGMIALVMQTFIVQAFKIPSGSMIPTFQIGDRIFVDKALRSARIPFINLRLPMPCIRQFKRGDIIVFVSPEDPKKDFVKRLIAFGGETVEIRYGRIYIDGVQLEEPASIRSITYYNSGEYGAEGQVVKVPKDSYFALGDNSASSRDSRFWGFIPKNNLVGKVVFIYWPIYRMRVVP